jgi:tetratricopeptide (TPR) repeat protein
MQPAVGQPASSLQRHGIAIRGTVRDATGKAVDGASVILQPEGSPALVAKTDAEGGFVFTAPRAGAFTVTAEMAGLRSRAAILSSSPKEDGERVDLVLEAAQSSSSGARAPSTRAMEFADQPDFKIAGVTDWTAVGGHGSDAILRTSEALARETVALPPDSSSGEGGVAGAGESEEQLRAAVTSTPGSYEANHRLGEFYLRSGRYHEAVRPLEIAYKIEPANFGNEYSLALAYEKAGDFVQARAHLQNLLVVKNDADLRRLSGDVDEALGDPLAAVKEYEQAVRLDPSEQNYFAWGSELLLHRAVWQAQEVFDKGAAAYPKSARMLAALGAALFAGARYDDAALRLCDASDLNPTDPEPYIFLGKIGLAAPAPLPCVHSKLARFAQERPDDALANYFYAMAILKQGETSGEVQPVKQAQALLIKAVSIDPTCSDAYLQLGIIAFSRHNYEAAIGLYKSAIAANSQLGEAHYRLGVAYDRIGEADKARQEFQVHDVIEKEQAATIEQQRREIKQFLVVLQGKPESSTVQ